MVDPIDYSSGLNQSLLTGARLGSLFADAKQQQMTNEQAQQQQQRQQKYFAALESTPSDQLHTLRTQFPEYAEPIQKEIGIQDAEHAAFVNNALNKISVAASSGNTASVQESIAQNKAALMSFGVDPQEAIQMAQNDPPQFNRLLSATRLATMPIEKQVNAQQKQQALDETARNNDLTNARGWGQIAVSRENSQRSAAGQGQTPASVREYEYFNSLSPEQQKTYMRVRGRPDAGMDGNTVQLSDGRTVSVSGKLHGAGASAFYEGTDTNGNMVRVPVGAISAPPTSAASAQNYGMKKDLDLISGASSDDLDFMTGVTGGSGAPALGADVRSRVSGKDQRQLYIATQRIQGRMQNQGIEAARDMGASGINTADEARLYFQAMPQIDYSSPEAMQQSVRNIQEYTKIHNRQNQVNVGNGDNQQATKQPSAQQPAGGSFTSKSGITFTVK